MAKGFGGNSLLIGILLLLFLLAVATLCQQYEHSVVKENFRRWGWGGRRWGYPWWRRYYGGYGGYRRWRYRPWWGSYWPWGYYNSGYYYY